MIYKLGLLKLHRYLSDESKGDDIFILMNGQKVWPVDRKYNTVTVQENDLNLHYEVNKGDIIEFELWDFDSLSPNDLLGKLTVKALAHGRYLNDFTKTGADSSKYALEYEFG